VLLVPFAEFECHILAEMLELLHYVFFNLHFISQIHGLDWSPTHENQLATSSQDCTVKFFDITNPRRAESILTTTSPVWRARYTVSIAIFSFFYLT
jgi:WD40 repeat protein